MKIVRGQKFEGDDEKLAIGTLVYRGLVIYEDGTKLYLPFSPLFGEFLSKKAQTSGPKRKLELTGTEAGLWEYLRLHANQTCTFDDLLEEVWNTSRSQSSDQEIQRRGMQVDSYRLAFAQQTETIRNGRRNHQHPGRGL